MNEKEERELEEAEQEKDKTLDSGGVSKAASSTGRNQGLKKLKFSYNEKREYETIDDDIAQLEERIAQIEKDISLNSSDYAKLTRLTEEKESLDEELLNKMERWEYLNELAARIERGETEPSD